MGSPKPSEFESRRNITMKMFKRFAAALLLMSASPQEAMDLAAVAHLWHL